MIQNHLVMLDTTSITLDAISTPNRRFGVEIEMTGVSFGKIKEALSKNGIPVCEWNKNPDPSTLKNDYKTWLLMEDASINDFDDNGYGMMVLGCEVVTRILQGHSGLNELSAGLAAIRNMAGKGLRITKDCGLHVHVDVTDLTLFEALILLERYHRFENQIDEWMHYSRRNGNVYCLSLENIITSVHFALNEVFPPKKLHNRRIGDMKKEELDFWVNSFMPSRHYKVNFLSLPEKGTIEFRHHHGAIKEEAVTNWVRFLLNFVEASRNVANVIAQMISMEKEKNHTVNAFDIMDEFMCENDTVFLNIPSDVREFFLRRSRFSHGENNGLH